MINGQRRLPTAVIGSKGMKWKYDDDLCVCKTKETEIHVVLKCKCYELVRKRWMRTWDVLLFLFQYSTGRFYC